MSTGSSKAPVELGAFYAELIEKDGGRYDCRHGMGAAPFTAQPGGIADKLIPLLTHPRVLGEDAEVVQLGLIHAPCHESWAALSLTNRARATTPRVHRHGTPMAAKLESQSADRSSASARPTARPSFGWALVSPSERRQRVWQWRDHTRPAGSAIVFDYQLLHRGLKNANGRGRPMLYAICGTRCTTRTGIKACPAWLVASTASLPGRRWPVSPFRPQPSWESSPPAHSPRKPRAPGTRARASPAATVPWCGGGALLARSSWRSASSPRCEKPRRRRTAHRVCGLRGARRLVLDAGEAELDAQARAKRQRHGVSSWRRRRRRRRRRQQQRLRARRGTRRLVGARQRRASEGEQGVSSASMAWRRRRRALCCAAAGTWRSLRGRYSR